MVRSYHSIDDKALASFAQRLVRTPSLSTHEDQVAALVEEEMHDAGLADVTVDQMGSVIGHIGSGEPGQRTGRVLVYDAHMDTVDVGDIRAWERDPFGGEIERGILYGRGAAGSKGALAAMVYAGKSLAESGVSLAGDLYFVGVVQEEPCEGLAMRHIVEEQGIHPDWVVIGEATNLQLSRGHRGRIEFRLTIHGRSCHASAPQRGVNAIYEAARVIVGLELLAPQLSQDSFLGKGSIAVTDISSTSASLNAVPDSCTLYIDRRLTIGETEAKALAEIKRILTREGIRVSINVSEYAGTSYTGHATKVRQCFPYWVTPEDAPLLVTAVRVIEDTLAFVPYVGKWDFATDGVYTAGIAGIPTIGFGPGEERHAHSVDDQVRVRDLEAAARVYAELAVRMLGRA